MRERDSAKEQETHLHLLEQRKKGERAKELLDSNDFLPGGDVESVLFRVIEKGKSAEDDLISSCQRLVGSIVFKYSGSDNYDDLRQDGNIGLLKAMKNYDPEKKASFATYARRRIEGEIIDRLRQGDSLPRSDRKKINDLRQVEEALEEKLSRPPTTKELVEKTGVSEESEINELRITRALSGFTMCSLEDLMEEDGDWDKVIRSDGRNNRRETEDVYEKTESDKLIIYKIVDVLVDLTKRGELTDRQYDIFINYFIEEMTFKEIGEVLGVSESRISQFFKPAMLILRNGLLQAGFSPSDFADNPFSLRRRKEGKTVSSYSRRRRRPKT